MKTIKTVSGENIEITENMRFVTMTDKILSGWGQAQNRTAKHVIICENWRQAQIIEDGIKNCRDNNGMRYINVCLNLPNYPSSKYKVSYNLYKDCPLYIKESNIREN